MRRWGLIIWIMFGLCCIGKAQYQGASWPIMYNNLMLRITADTFERDSLPYGTYGFLANSSISDFQGTLLFYSCGVDARNKEGAIMDSGCCLCEDTADTYACSTNDLGNPHSQGAIILPRPSSSLQYYLFIKDESVFVPYEQPARITASLIDLSYNNQLGKVIQRAFPILNGALSDSRMTACQHGNGRDWWLINHEYLTNKIYTHLITPDSILGPFEQSVGLPGLEPDNAGWSIFSPNTNVFATTTAGMGAITLLDFDRCSGTFGNFRSINTSASTDSTYYFNLAFSPSGRFLYASNSYWLEQYDIQDTNIEASRVQLIHDTASYPLLGQMVLMPNGKIYQVGWTVEDSMLSVIDSPDVKGLGCGFHLRSVLVPNSIEITNVPNFPNYNLGPLVGSGCDTITTNVANLTKAATIQIQPNPADNYAEINIEPPGNYEVQLMNALGQLIKTSAIEKSVLMSTGSLSQGLYFLKVIDKTTGVDMGVKRLVVMH